MFCQKQFQKLTRHQRRRHKEEPSVEAAMKLKAGSDEQILAFEKIRLTGDYHHNCNVLAVGEGELIVVRKPSKATPQAKFLPCPHCLGFFKSDELWRHCLVCQHKATIDDKKWKKVQAEAKLLLPTCSVSNPDVDAHLYKNVISSTRNDTISCVARRDQLITNFGAAIHEKVGIKKMPTTFLRGCDSWRAFSRRSAFRVKEKIRASKSSLTPPCLMLWWMQSRISAGLMQRRT